MTSSGEDDGQYTTSAADYRDVIPVNVRVVEDSTETKPVTADYGGYLTRQDIPDVSTGIPIQILARAINRHRAFLKVTTLTGGSTPAVLISNNQQALQRGPGFGFAMFQGDTLEVKNQQPLFAITVGVPTAVSVSILDERWESDTE